MTTEEVKAAIKDLSVSDRRKVALYILELEKDRIKTTVGPQLEEDLDSVAKLMQNVFEKLKSAIKDGK